MPIKRTFIIAEIGSCHDGSFGNAVNMIRAAARCGVDAVKFQLHIAEAETTRDAPMPPFFKGESRFEYFKRTSFSPEQWVKLWKECKDNGVEFIASSFSVEAVDILEELGVRTHKVPSGEVTNLPLLKHMARTGKRILLSTGMSDYREIGEAIATIREHNDDLVVLQCSTAYPTKYEQVGLNVLAELRKRFKVRVGLSDHTLTNYSAFAAVIGGAEVIEKHFTLSRLMYGSDARNSLEPREFTDLVKGIRAIGIMLNTEVDKDDLSSYRDMKITFEKSIVAARDILKGEVIHEDMLAYKKPGDGMRPSERASIIGKKVTRDIMKDTKLSPGDLE
jgi:N-acetylneuraminate synthase